MSEHFDAIVVGSGFGGSVMAYRLAEAGMRVCIFERGQQYPPGSFARSPSAISRNFWDPGAGLQGLIDLWTFSGLDAAVACGVGGGSLIYSNVLLRKDERWFVTHHPSGSGNQAYERWPITRADLDPHYDQVEKILNGQSYPVDREPYASTPKTVAMTTAAKLIGQPHLYPKLAVAFGNAGAEPRPGEPLCDRPGHNMYGVPRSTCRLCGECNVGCNYGSKETLDLTYLSLATAAGADLRPRCEVRAFEPLRTRRGYRVDYCLHEPTYAGASYRRCDLPQKIATCRYLILAAGTFGSTYLLLRMKRDKPAFHDLSPALGTRVSGNGDLLTLIMRTHMRDDRSGKLKPRVIDPTRGPVITTAIRIPDDLDRVPGQRGRGIYIQDAGYPAFFAWLVESVPAGAWLSRVLKFGCRYLASRLNLNDDTNLSAEVSEFIGDATLTNSTLPLLSMGRDTPSGGMSIREDNMLDVKWNIDESIEYVERVRANSRLIAQALRGEHKDNPLWHLRRLVTVHPLGGTPMGHHKEQGVVDSFGRVFDYPGLLVTDGSIMPGPVGPNPALTIAATANRAADALIDEWKQPARRLQV